MTWGPLTYLGHSQSISVEKLDIKHVLCLVFENMTYPLVVLGLVDVVAVDELDLEASDISEIIPSRFLLKNWV